MKRNHVAVRELTWVVFQVAALLATGCQSSNPAMDAKARVEFDPPVYDIQDLAWSPTENQLAFRALRYPQDVFHAIYVYDADSGELRRYLEGANSLAYRPSWTPDGKSVAVTAGDGQPLTVIDILSGTTSSLGYPAPHVIQGFWDPGQSLVYGVVDPDGQEREVTFEVYDLKRSEMIRQITIDQGDLVSPLQSAWDSTRQQLAISVERQRLGDYEIGILDLASGQVGWLSIRGRSLLSPSWSPDGQWLAYVENSRPGQLVIRRLSDGCEVWTTLALDEPEGLSWSFDGALLAVSTIRELYVASFQSIVGFEYGELGGNCRR